MLLVSPVARPILHGVTFVGGVPSLLSFGVDCGSSRQCMVRCLIITFVNWRFQDTVYVNFGQEGLMSLHNAGLRARRLMW